MAKEYKPGQFVSLGGKIYRVSKLCSPVCYRCPICPREDTAYGQLILPDACEVKIECAVKLPARKGKSRTASYPIPLKPKHQG